MNSVSTMLKYFQDNLPKDRATSKIHPGDLTPLYQASIISILPQEDVSSVCLLLKNQNPEQQFEILKNKIQQLHEEAHRMSVRFNSTPVSQTSLITIPNPSVSNNPIKPNITTPDVDLEEMSLEETSLEDLKETNNRLENAIQQ